MQVYFNRSRRTFLRFQEGRKWNYYVTNLNGLVKLVKVAKDEDDLIASTDPKATPQHFAEVWLKSGQDLTERAKQVLIAARDAKPVKLSDPETMPTGVTNFPGEPVLEDEEPIIEDDKPARKKVTKKVKEADPVKDEADKPKVRTVSKLGDLVSLKEVCKRAGGIEPRLARVILRAAVGKAEGRWEWPEDEVQKIVKILKSANT